ncbi:hypothetical protein Vi05172_g2774 [Venturia inaequalis]|nr:hypothetical protein Vi05172_g2774 [Venturia inaequalis]
MANGKWQMASSLDGGTDRDVPRLAHTANASRHSETTIQRVGTFFFLCTSMDRKPDTSSTVQSTV